MTAPPLSQAAVAGSATCGPPPPAVLPAETVTGNAAAWAGSAAAYASRRNEWRARLRRALEQRIKESDRGND